MNVALVIDVTLSTPTTLHRKAAFKEIQRACHSISANLHHIPFQKLDSGEISIMNTFHNADVAIVDVSIQDQQYSLFYLLGNRERFEMKQDILLFNDSAADVVNPIKLPTSNFNIVTYRLSDDKRCYITEPYDHRLVTNSDDSILQSPLSSETKMQLWCRLQELLLEVKAQTKARMKEKFLADLRKAHESLTGDELAVALHDMRIRMEHDLDRSLVSADIVHNMLISFREIQDYDAMVQMIDDLESLPNSTFTYTPPIRHLYAFALNRRKRPGDRERALQMITNALQQEENHFPDMLCLVGRIYKDIFVESSYEDKESLENAIKWYGKGFEVQPNVYAGINLATLLVIKGNDFAKCSELKEIASVLHILIGRKGSLASIQDYWEVATFFEISVLAENYSKAIQAAECMFKLKPPVWYLKSTIGNIQLINQFKRKPEDAILTPEEQIFQFWMEYFIDATNNEVSNVIRFPMLVLEFDNIFIPSHVTVNMNGQNDKFLQINNICLQCLRDKEACKQTHSWLFSASTIGGVSLYKVDQRCLFLYVHHNSDGFQMFFPSEELRKRFYDLVIEMTTDEEGICALNSTIDTIKSEYEFDKRNRKFPITDNLQIQSSNNDLKKLSEFKVNNHSFQVLSKIGDGGSSDVYHVYDPNEKKTFALKVVEYRDFENLEEIVDNYKYEIDILMKLRECKNVVYLHEHEHIESEKRILLLLDKGEINMEILFNPFFEGEISSKERDPDYIKFYFKQMVKAVEEIHKHNVVHSDLKPENFILFEGRVKLIDFGISSIINENQTSVIKQSNFYLGTVDYMSPETLTSRTNPIFMGKGKRLIKYNKKTDIWSLGCILYDMACGHTPFQFCRNKLRDIKNPKFKINYSEVKIEAKGLVDCIKKCLQYDPNRRPTASELLDDPFLISK